MALSGLVPDAQPLSWTDRGVLTGVIARPAPLFASLATERVRIAKFEIEEESQRGVCRGIATLGVPVR